MPMYRSCTTQKTADQQRALSETLLRLCQHQPYGSVTVCHLCEAAGFSRKVFYRLFDGKEDVLVFLIDRALTGYIPLPCISQWEGHAAKGLVSLCAYWRGQKPLLDLLAREGRMGLLVERSVQQNLAPGSDALKWLDADASPYREEILVYYLSGLLGLLIRWYQTGFARSDAELSALMYTLLTHTPVLLPR